MRDVIYTPYRSRFEGCVDGEENLTRPCIYIKRSSHICQPLKWYPLVPDHISVTISKKSTSK